MKTIFVTIAGSRAYGTHTSESDVDLTGIYVGPKSSYLSFDSTPETIVDKKDTKDKWTNEYILPESINDLPREGTLFELRKFCKLALHCNPNILDVLFGNQGDVVHETTFSRLLISNRKHFLSRIALKSFYGYSMDQLRHVREFITKCPTGEAAQGTTEGANGWRNRGVITDKKVNKHAMHVVRLLQSFEELVLTGEYKTKRDNVEELKCIRRGEWTVEWLEDFIQKMNNKYPQLEKQCILPQNPNIEVIHSVVMEITSKLLL